MKRSRKKRNRRMTPAPLPVAPPRRVGRFGFRHAWWFVGLICLAALAALVLPKSKRHSTVVETNVLSENQSSNVAVPLTNTPVVPEVAEAPPSPPKPVAAQAKEE